MRLTRTCLSLGLACLLLIGVLAPVTSAEEPKTKPAFALKDPDGKVHRLSDYRGKWVVLEWTHFDCDAVREQYAAPAQKLPSLQRAYAKHGVVWLTINSSAPGKKGYLDPAKCKEAIKRMGASPTALLLDPTGKVGKSFDAKVAPEVRVISPKGDIAYAGGIESTGTATPVSYVVQVLNAAVTGKAIPYTAQARRGCMIEYAAAGTPSVARGPQAPDFTLTDTAGRRHSLSAYRGKWVILEWVNYDCPFVQKHYHSSHRRMQSLQAESKRMGIVWLSICSSKNGKQGHFTAGQANGRMRQMGATPSAYLMDPTGAVGRAYGARTTPDMRVISPQGTIEYAGGIDSIRSMRASDVGKAQNYVALALKDIAARRPIAIRNSRPYGCSVKY